ncbi:MAG: hypothetical protein MZV49_21795 [Rhodopseudomonas palustris]|nr:hypothetical protein [Rhodopseudomonas palustris]
MIAATASSKRSFAAYRELLGGGSTRADRSLAEAPIPDMAVPRLALVIVKRAKRRK